MRQHQSVSSPVSLSCRCVSSLVCPPLSNPHRITLSPQPKATPGHERGLRALFVRSGYCCRRRSQGCTSLLLTAGAPILLRSSRMGLTANDTYFVRSKSYTPDASGRVRHLKFYIAQSLNTKIPILTRAQRTEVSAALPFYVTLM